jgi:hypothetical protein
MPGRKQTPKLLDELALNVASGGRIQKWALDNGIPERTAYQWAKTEGFSEKVRGFRQEVNDATVGRLVSLARKATRELENLLGPNVTESVKLGAIRTVLSSLVDLSDWHDLESRLSAVERKVGSEGKQTKTTRKSRVGRGQVGGGSRLAE